MKRIWSRGLALLLTLAFVVSGIPFAVSAEEDGKVSTHDLFEETPIDEFLYYEEAGGIVIQKYLGDRTEVVIPAVIDGKPVVSIGNRAFELEEQIVTLVFPDTVTQIGPWAFNKCRALKELYLPAQLTRICDHAFQFCEALELVRFPDALKVIELGAFGGCEGLVYVELPNGVEELQYYAFGGCDSLKIASVPSSVIKMEERVFMNCYNLGLVLCGPEEQPAEWDSEWLYNAKSLVDIRWGSCTHTDLRYVETVEAHCGTNHYDLHVCNSCGEEVRKNEIIGTAPGHAYVGEICVACGETDAEKFRWTYSSQYIGISVFEYIGDSTAIAVPEVINGVQVKELGGLAGWPTRVALEEVRLPNSIKEIHNTFYKQALLRKVNLPTALTRIDANAFEGCTALEELSVPAGVKTIRRYAFKDCHSLHTVTLPEGLECIERHAFYNCKSLREIVVPQSVTELGCTYDEATEYYCYEGVFEGCSSLERAVLPDGLTELTSHLFMYCENLKTVNLPSQLKIIGSSVFNGCKQLQNIVFPSTLEEVGSCSFTNCAALVDVILPEGLTTIRNQAFFNCTGLKHVEIPSTVKVIEGGAFSFCGKLEEVVLRDGLTSLNAPIFWGTYALKTIHIPESLTVMGESVFVKTGLTDIYCDAAKQPSGWHTNWKKDCTATVHWNVKNCTHKNTAEKVIESTCVAEGYRATVCKDCGKEISRETMRLAEHQYGADRRCAMCGDYQASPLADFVYEIRDDEAIILDYKGVEETVVIPSEIDGCPVTTIEAFAFDECKMVSVVIPDTVRTIRGGAFYLCEKLKSVTIPYGVETIEETVFGDCTALTAVVLPASVKNLSPEIFSGCDSLTSLEIEDGCTAYHSAGNCIIETKTGTLIQGCAGSVIPDDGSVKKIGDNAFASVRKLTSIDIPYGVTEIGRYAFDSTALTELYIPASVTKVGKYILYYSKATTVYCGASSKPAGWDSKWLSGVDAEVIWGYCPHTDVRTESVEATCIDDGYSKEICDACGKVLSETTVPATGKHTYFDGVCSGCGKETQMVKPGDIDGNDKYTAVDYVLLKRVLTGEHELSEDRWIYADVDGNGRLEAFDYALLKAHILGLVRELPLRPEDLPVEQSGYADRYGDQIANLFGDESGSGRDVEYTAGQAVLPGYHFLSNITGVTLRNGVTSIGDGAFAWCEFSYEIYIPASVEYVGSYAFAYSGFVDIYVQADSLPDGWEEDWLAGSNATVHWGVEPPCEHEDTQWERISGATCTKAGLEQLICVDCGEILDERITPATGHQGTEQKGYAATCTQDGLDHLYCRDCDTALRYEVIPAKGHTPGEAGLIRKPSCTKPGVDGIACEICGELLEYVEIPANGHTYGKQDRCIVCGTFRGDSYSDFAFEITDEGVIITGYVGDKTDVKIPAEIQGYPVIKIGDAAFESKNIQSVSFPATLREIGMFAFENCKNLKKISIPGSVKLIGGSAFMDCIGLESVFLGEGIETIGSGAFSGCVKLTSVQFPASLLVLEDSVLLGCDSLKHLGVAGGNSVYHSQGNCIIETATGTLLVGCAASVIPDDGSVTAIGAGAFSCVKGLKNITIPNCITSIGKDAFRSSDLEYLYIPASVTKLGAYAFFDTPSLQVIYCEAKEAPAGWTEKWNSGCDAEIVWDYTTCKHEHTYISAMCEPTCEEGGYTVYSCRSCSEVVERKEFAATGHKYDKKHKCANCGNVEGLQIQMMVGYVVVVGYQGNASALEIPEEIEGLPVMGIQSGAFEGNDTLKSVFIPSTVESVEAGAFSGCEKLEEILCETDSMPTTWEEDWAGDVEVNVAWEAAPKPTIMYGDVSGDNRIAVVDYVLLKRHVMGTSTLSENQLGAADVNRDGRINTMDYVLLKRHVLGTFTIKQDS